MLETLIAAQGRTFSGTFMSTFSGYIVRMRGYLGRADNSTYAFVRAACRAPPPPPARACPV